MPTDEPVEPIAGEQASQTAFKRDVEYTTRFRKDYKRERKGRHRTSVESILEAAISLLADDLDLPEYYKDHALSGDWNHHRDSHLKPDLVLIYRKYEDPPRLVLTRIGSHSELGI